MGDPPHQTASCEALKSTSSILLVKSLVKIGKRNPQRSRVLSSRCHGTDFTAIKSGFSFWPRVHVRRTFTSADKPEKGNEKASDPSVPGTGAGFCSRGPSRLNTYVHAFINLGSEEPDIELVRELDRTGVIKRAGDYPYSTTHRRLQIKRICLPNARAHTGNPTAVDP